MAQCTSSVCSIKRPLKFFIHSNIYRICTIERCGYYLFHRAILCGFYSRVATNRERRLLNSVVPVWVKVFCKCKGFDKSQFYKINEELRRGDLVLKTSSSVLISHHFPTKRYLHGTSNQYNEDEDELQENELVLEDY